LPAGYVIKCRRHEMPFVTGTAIILIAIGTKQTERY
jgi:hypothetical protein